MRSDRDTEGGRPCGDGERGWADAATTQDAEGTRSWTRQEMIAQFRIFARSAALPTPCMGLLASRTVRGYISAVNSPSWWCCYNTPRRA